MKKLLILSCILLFSCGKNEPKEVAKSISFISPIPEKIEKKAFDTTSLLWYTKAAEKWEEALPVGNGRIGGMVFGGVEEEQIQLNEETYWSGGPYNSSVKGGYKELPKIQQLIFEKYGRSYISNSLVEIYPEKESLCQTHYGELNYQFKSLSTILPQKVTLSVKTSCNILC